MLFNSLSFCVFFPIVTLIYFALPHARRWLWLLAASCVFYMAFVPIYILILAATILVDYFAAIWIEDSRSRARKKTFLVVSIVSTCLILFVFKYFNFFTGNHYALKLILPIGLSFHTFQSLSYVIEVYRGNQKAERHFGIYALYVMFYPQLVAGPIERPQNLLHQFRAKHKFDYDRVTHGLKRMAWGLFKKVAIADRLALLVNQVYDNPHGHAGPALIVATVCFAIQIYCDFSGYSDIALGSAEVMGFRLMENFKNPYRSLSVSEFWRRWHISLSTWFKDYVYVPLGGSRVSLPRQSVNLMITFLVSGLWHGANWTFVIWGGLNGLYLVAALWRDRFMRLPKLPVVARGALTFTLICLSWIFFRAANVSDGWYILTHLFKPGELGFAPYDLLLAAALVFVLEFAPSIRLSKQPTYIRWAAYYGLVLGVLFFGVFEQNQFIYFQF